MKISRKALDYYLEKLSTYITENKELDYKLQKAIINNVNYEKIIESLEKENRNENQNRV